MYTRIIVFSLLCEMLVTASEHLNPMSDEFIDLINKEGKWKAGRNFHPDTPIEYIMQLLGTKIRKHDFSDVPVVRHDIDLINSLPESFDPRDKWPNCPSLNEIRDQGRCGSCYAFGAVEAMTDRVCIYSNGTKNFHFSAEDVVTCSQSDYMRGCKGGDILSPWKLWVNTGYVSGGNYNSQEGCKPYTIPTCPHHVTKCTNYTHTPPCVRSCRDGYNATYKQDKRRGKKCYEIKGEDDIRAELFKNGPVESAFDVYQDFTTYKGGVYQHIRGHFLSGHAIKMMGWGVENGTKYWLVANSWNLDFGENGYFKILRGTNECGIETSTVAGEPLLEDY